MSGNNKKRNNIIFFTGSLVLCVLLYFKESLVYDFGEYKYTVAYNFKYAPAHSGTYYSYNYRIDGEEYLSSVRIGHNVNYGFFKKSDKYLVRYPVIAKWDVVEIYLEYKLPDTTSIPYEGWDSIPAWIIDSPQP